MLGTNMISINILQEQLYWIQVSLLLICITLGARGYKRDQDPIAPGAAQRPSPAHRTHSLNGNERPSMGGKTDMTCPRSLPSLESQPSVLAAGPAFLCLCRASSLCKSFPEAVKVQPKAYLGYCGTDSSRSIPCAG